MNPAAPMPPEQPVEPSSTSESSPSHPDVTGRYYVPGFPIGEGKTDYEKYLRTCELLSLQVPDEQAASPEELLFQVTHQASELWMKQMLHTLHRVLPLLEADELWQACRLMRQVHDIQRLLIQHVDLIAQHISIIEYEKIRLSLGQGSGMESPGFNWLLEMAPQLIETWERLLQRHGVPLEEIYRHYSTHIALHTVAEALVDYDDLFHKWRTHHYAMVARTIGTEANSLKGLSTQVLQKGVKTRFFPDLLALRSQITNASSVAYGGQSLGS